MSHVEFDEEHARKLPRTQVIRSLVPLFRPWIGHFAGALLLLVIAAALQVAGPLLVKRAIDTDIGGRDFAGLRRTVGLYLLVQALHLVTVYAMRNWLEWIGQHIMAGLKRRLVRHLLRLPLAFFDRHPPGKLLARVENDTQTLRTIFTTAVVMLVGDFLLFVGMFTAMAMVNLRLTLVTATILPVLVAITWYFQRAVHPRFLEVRRLTAEITGRLTEFLQGIAVLRAFERRAWAARHFQEVNLRKARTEYPAERLIVFWHNSVFAAETLAHALILGIGGWWAVGGAVTIGTLAMFVGYVRRFFEPLLRFSEQLAQMQRGLAAAERIRLLLDEPVAVADPPEESAAAWPGLAQEVRFEGVWFRYREDSEDAWVLRDVSFAIPAGQRWAVVGPTGSGKTTLVSLLLRFYDPQRGRVTVDGVDLRAMRQADLRGHTGLVLQDIYLFPGDLEANLTLGRTVARERIVEAARLTQAERVIARLPNGLGADLAERGGNLSVGERQLLSFTRAVLADPRLLVLDEATSAVDPATESLIGESMKHVLAGRTALIIAHRLSTIQSCDRILVLHHGRIVEEGTHEELVAAGGLYRTMVELQTRHELVVEEELDRTA